MQSAAPSPRFLAARPALHAERAAASPLFRSLEALRTRLAARGVSAELLQDELARFFDQELAPAVQQRESALINDLHACVQRELETRSARGREMELECSQLRAQLDRRVADADALRKQYYKQLLLLRDMVHKQSNDPKTLAAITDAITGAASPRRIDDASQGEGGGPSRPRTAGSADAVAMRREKEKWEHRVHEASAESQQLREQVAALQQQVDAFRQDEGSLWFLEPRNGVAERQRIIEAVFRAKCGWEDVGASVVEILSNETIWEAVEKAVRRKAARGPHRLEAAIAQLEAAEKAALDAREAATNTTVHDLVLASSLNPQRGMERLVPCRACNGAGYVSVIGSVDEDPDAYLRKTLTQVLELKTALEQETSRSTELEYKLQTTLGCYVELQEKFKRIEADKLLREDRAIQADLDDEEELALVAAMCSGEDDGSHFSSRVGKSKRVLQYEHLISELKNSLADKESGIRELRAAVESSQARLVSLQRQSQQEQDGLKREISALKASLALSMKHRNSNIDEKQAAVKFLIKRLTNSQRDLQQRRASRSLTTQIKEEGEEHPPEEGDDDDDDQDSSSSGDDNGDDEHEIERSEKIARRYSDAINRVQKEFEDQKARMSQLEGELQEQEAHLKRTNSISLGNIVVSMSSHPRDLFKALSTAQSEIGKMRRASQKSSTLQADRLLTLTTHLSHISEELCMVRKRTNAELDYWKLECEKLQNNNEALTSEQGRILLSLREAEGKVATMEVVAQSCVMCDKHQARLTDISNWLLTSHKSGDDQDDGITKQPPDEADGVLSEHDRQAICGLVLEIEQLLSTMVISTQEEARGQLVRAFGGRVPTRFGSSAEGSPDIRSSTIPMSSTSYADWNTKHRGRRQSAGVNRMLVVRDVLRSMRPQSAPMAREDKRVASSPSQPQQQQLQTSTGIMAQPERTDIPSMAAMIRNNGATGDPLAVLGRTVENGDQWQQALARTLASNNDSPRDSSPSYRRKTTVRKHLSQQEYEQRNRGRITESNAEWLRFIGEHDAATDPAASSASAEDVHYAVYTGDSTEDVYPSGGDASDDEERDCYPEDDGQHPSPRTESLNATSTWNGDNRGDTLRQSSFKTPPSSLYTLESRRSNHSLSNQATRSAVISRQPTSDRLHQFVVLPPGTKGIGAEYDPPVIQQLRELLRLNDDARERFAIANWEVLVARAKVADIQHRLAEFTLETHVRLSEGLTTVRSGIRVVNSALERMARHYSNVLDAALSERQEAKRNCRKVQSQLMHGVATIFTSLSQRNRRNAAATMDTTNFRASMDAGASVGRRVGAGWYRPVYPSTQVNLSCLPPTQQLSTSTFPIVNPASPVQHSTPPISLPVLLNDAGKDASTREASASNEAPSPERYSHACFPRRVIKFVGPNNSSDFCLTHSAAVLGSTASVPDDSASPSKRDYDTQAPTPRRTRPERPESANATLSPHSPRQSPMRPQSSPVRRSLLTSPRLRDAASQRFDPSRP